MWFLEGTGLELTSQLVNLLTLSTKKVYVNAVHKLPIYGIYALYWYEIKNNVVLAFGYSSWK